MNQSLGDMKSLTELLPGARAKEETKSSLVISIADPQADQIQSETEHELDLLGKTVIPSFAVIYTSSPPPPQSSSSSLSEIEIRKWPEV